ncbi:BRO family protein [Pseudooceanicola sp. HF7]|uniref:BRO-N domain-containing protein n=1 Tax=Pseudooceanicola sp. HF7 TaxID=2721560 RepID=UPI001C37925E
MVTLEGEPWFVAADVCRALGLSHITNALRPLNTKEVSNFNRITLGVVRAGRPMKLVTESGLYKLILRSNKPEARALQEWVTSTVLPAIRKDGSYIMGEEKA